MTKLPHFHLESHCYFVTSTTWNKSPIFAKEENALILWNIINKHREKDRFYLLAFVIMPEHLHLLIIPKDKTNISFIMQEIKKGSARIINNSKNKSGKVWMDEYYEHIVRDEKELMEKIRYIHHNPVKRGLIDEERKYSFSSANPEYEQFLFRGW